MAEPQFNSAAPDRDAPDLAEIAAWRARRPHAREPVAATVLTAGSATAFFILAVSVISAVVVYYQGH